MKKYCSYCGRELVSKILLDGSTEKYCVKCDHVFFEEPSPAVIVAVMNGEKILLTRSVGWQHHYWGLVAGHVKSGETTEEAAMREVKEEVGIDTMTLEIVGTYAIKDRNLLMIGFQAKPSQLLHKPDPGARGRQRACAEVVSELHCALKC